MHPILRITLKSNKKAQNRNWDQTRVISPRNPRFAGQRGTGQTGRLAGENNGGGRGGGGGGGGVASAGTTGVGENGGRASGASDSVGDRKSPHIPVGQSNSAASVSSFRSTGGPTSFVPTGLIA